MKTLTTNIWLIGFLLILSSLSVRAELPAIEQVKTSVDAILAVLKNTSIDPDIRRVKIRELLNDRFYFRAMSQRALSRHWKKASPDQQKQFVHLFSRLLENTYIGRIEAYTDERIEYKREKIKSPKRAVVYTQISTGSADIPINYKMAKKGSEWLIYDVVIEEISLISNYRTSYAEIIKKVGMDGLLRKMKKKIDEGVKSADEKAG